MDDVRVVSKHPGLRGYISYSHADRAAVHRLTTHLSVLSLGGRGVGSWTDAEITAGRSWYDAVVDCIAAADVFITCVSPSYLASEFRYNVEWPSIMARVRASGAVLVPVILRPCSWFGFVDLVQAVPTDKGRVRPVSEWRPRDAGYSRAAGQILDAIQHGFTPDGHARDPLPAVVEIAAVHMVPFAPAGTDKLTSDDMDEAVRAIISRRLVRSVA